MTQKQQLPLPCEWQLCQSNPGQYPSPQALPVDGLDWREAPVPGTVAMAVNAEAPGCWQPGIDYSDFDWWYRCQLPFEEAGATTDKVLLNFEGLATLCTVWLNGEVLLNSQNMFLGQRLDVTDKLQASNELLLQFRSESAELKQKRPRPRWKTKLVRNQQMRWIRSTVLGHVSAWTPPVKVVGPWQGITLERLPLLDANAVRVASQMHDSGPQVTLQGVITLNDNSTNIDHIELLVGDHSYPLSFSRETARLLINDQIAVEGVEHWWPHTHNDQPLYDCRLIIHSATGSVEHALGRLGFKKTEFSLGDDVRFRINDTDIFCRGACWSVSDYLSLSAPREQLQQQLTLARDAGINMLRVGGTMVYESDAFYELCDELGLLVWQDFMFASMDYPLDDETFSANANAEVRYQLQRLSRHVCIASYCGNTDVEAQAAMYGMPAQIHSNDFFDQDIPGHCKALHPGIPYIPSSPTGGAMPFHLGAGVSHYWGVGAYMHQPADTDIARVKFASEGMGLSHIPIDASINQWLDPSTEFPYNSDWIKRIPRDLGAGWDFEENRDFYLTAIFGDNAVELRRQHVQKYIALSRIVSGEVIARVYNQWRKFGSQCGGGLIWFYRDFWPCAGFGLIDSDNQAKPAYYIIKRAWASRIAIINDEGLDGATITINNEKAQALNTKLELQLLRNNGTEVATAEQQISVPGHGQLQVQADAMLGRFFDTAYAYRFGPSQFDAVVCHWQDEASGDCGDAFFFPNGYSLSPNPKTQVSAVATVVSGDCMELTIKASGLLYFSQITVRDFIAEDNYCHIAPGRDKTITLRRSADSGKSFKGQLEALNLEQPVKITMANTP